MPSRSIAEAARAVKPRAFTLELTKGCNLRCGYCYYAQREDAYDPRTRMSPEVAEGSIDLLLAESEPAEPVHVHFFGGEPLLDFPLLARTLLYGERRAAAAGKAITFEVTTNGTRFTDEVIAFLNEHAVHVGVSFDGPPELQDAARPAAAGSSYAQAAPGTRALLASRRGTELERKTHCSVVLTRRSADVVAIASHLEELGFTRIILTPATDLEGESNGFGPDDLPEVLAAYDRLADAYEEAVAAGRPVAVEWFPKLMERLLSGERREHFCQGGREYLGVAADGDINLCYRFYEDDAFAMGSVADGIDRGVTERLLEHSLMERTTCSRCWARHFCGGGCHHDNVTVGGELSEPNPVTCDLFRHGMGRTLEAWVRLSRAGRLGGRAPVDAPGDAAPAAPTVDGGTMGDRANATFEESDRPRRSPGCHVRDLDGEQVVYDPATHEVVVLNGTAAFIFGLCDGERSVAELLAELQRTFDAPADVLRRDLLATLAELRSKRLFA